MVLYEVYTLFFRKNKFKNFFSHWCRWNWFSFNWCQCPKKDRFPDCAALAKCVLDAFESRKKLWAVYKENHSDKVLLHGCKIEDNSTLAVSFANLMTQNNIVVNFSRVHCGYVAAYRYACKDTLVEVVPHNCTMKVI